ncbi:MAG: hypothetical protein V3V04_02705 [Rhizobiaceae bacterium]
MKNSALCHGSVILLGCDGIIIQGNSGSGKSRLAHQLVQEWKNRGLFSSWVGDDQIILQPHKNGIIAQPPEATKGLAERRFSGIQNVTFEDSAQLSLIVKLIEQTELERMPEQANTAILKGTLKLPTINAPKNNIQLACEIVTSYLETHSSNK